MNINDDIVVDISDVIVNIVTHITKKIKKLKKSGGVFFFLKKKKKHSRNSPAIIVPTRLTAGGTPPQF